MIAQIAERLIRRVKRAKRMLGDKAYDERGIARGTGRTWEPSRSFPDRSEQEATVQLQQASLQATLAHRECVQQTEGLQAHRNPIRQAGAKLLGLCLPRRRSCLVDLISLDPSSCPPSDVVEKQCAGQRLLATGLNR